ncbi:MAG: GIY-YIG nuclease family protein [Chloroflexaceae bacterium]|nr:GIY-YIG nuclease family protein [Chloroflexaceae bacterium]
MPKPVASSSITIRCPQTLVDSIDRQAEQTRQNKTDVIIEMLLSSLPSLHLTERAKLPAKPGIYFVYMPDHRLLHVGKADNLRKRWGSHHKYQFFVESSMESRIGYFVFDSVSDLKATIEEFSAEPTETATGKALVTADEFRDLKEQVAFLKQQFHQTVSALANLGSDSYLKKLQAYLPPRGQQDWNFGGDDTKQGLTRSDLIQRLNFGTSKALEDAATFLEIDPDEYLEELSGWKRQPVEEGSNRTRFFPAKKS